MAPNRGQKEKRNEEIQFDDSSSNVFYDVVFANN